MLRVLNHPEGAEQLLNDVKSCRLIELNFALSGKVWLTKAEPRMLVLNSYYYYHTKAPSMCPFTERPWGGELLFFFLLLLFLMPAFPHPSGWIMGSAARFCPQQSLHARPGVMHHTRNTLGSIILSESRQFRGGFLLHGLHPSEVWSNNKIIFAPWL